jgi:hypothetical protein
MAVYATATSQAISRATGAVSPSSNYSCAFWVMFLPSYTAIGRVLWMQVDDVVTYAQWIAIWTAFGTTTTAYLEIGTGGATVATTAGSTISLNTWAAVAYTRSGNTHSFYVNGVLIGTTVVNVSAYAVDEVWMIGDAAVGTDTATKVQNFREWNAALSLNELMAEWNSATPVRTSGLVTNTPLSSTYTDTTSNGNDWTATGALSFATSAVPMATTNSAATSAHVINETDVYVQVPKDTGGDVQDSWWSYTTSTDPILLGVWGQIDTQQSILDCVVSAWLGPASAPVVIDPNVQDATNVPMVVPVESATTYYFRATWFGGGTDTALAFSVREAPQNTAAVGSLLVAADFHPYPASIISTSGNPLQYRANLPVGEGGDVLDSGMILAADDITDEIVLLSNQLQELVRLPWVTANAGTAIRAHVSSGQFYVSKPGTGGAASEIYRVSSAGVVSSLVATLPYNNVQAIAVNDAQTILYYSVRSLGTAVHRWDLVGNVAMSDFVAGVASKYAGDMRVLNDDTVLLAYPTYAELRSTAAALLQTYTFATAVNPDDPRLARAIDDPDSFWVKYNDGTPTAGLVMRSGFGRLTQFDTATAARLTDLNLPLYDGDYVGPLEFDEAYPSFPRFGRFTSCTLVVLREELPPPGGGTPGGGGATAQTFIPRRLRRAPHLSDEQRRTRFNSFQLDMETGIGNTVAPGDDPQIMFRWSDDGGHTWSNEHWVSAGRRGVYTWRALWRRLGASRDRVYEVSYSEPTKFNLVNAIIDAEEGDS